jgi:hypothetical protein
MKTIIKGLGEYCENMGSVLCRETMNRRIVTVFSQEVILGQMESIVNNSCPSL